VTIHRHAANNVNVRRRNPIVRALQVRAQDIGFAGSRRITNGVNQLQAMSAPGRVTRLSDARPNHEEELSE
jgi:hypothetical protein